MDYQKVNVVLHPYHQEAAELMMAQMGELGFESFVENETGFEGYIPFENYSDGLMAQLDPVFEGVRFTYSLEQIADQNWNKVWEENFFQPILIGNDCWVRSPFHAPREGVRYDILIEPKMSFGTGHHETTSLMMEFILDLRLDGKSVLDMGCGTGILGILAAKHGASKVRGIDIDEWCYHNTLENIEINHINAMTVEVGDASVLGPEKYDVVLANINRNILLHDMSHYANALQPGGVLIMSGFYEQDLPLIHQEAVVNHLEKILSRNNNNWVAVAYRS